MAVGQFRCDFLTELGTGETDGHNQVGVALRQFAQYGFAFGFVVQLNVDVFTGFFLDASAPL